MKNKLLLLCLWLLLLFSSCENDANFAEIYDDMTIELANPGVVLYADSVSSARITATFEESLDKNQKVTFTTSHGVLYKMPYDPTAKGEKELSFAPFANTAEVLLRAETLVPENEVYVSISVNGYSKDLVVPFLSARPDDMLLCADPQILSAGEDSEITAKLFRNPGYTSDRVRFDILDSLEVSDTTQVELIYNIPDFVFSSNNEVKIPVDIMQHSDSSHIRVIVSTIDAQGTSLAKSILLRLD